MELDEQGRMSFKPWFFENRALLCLFKASSEKESANKAPESFYFLQEWDGRAGAGLPALGGGTVTLSLPVAVGQAEGAGQWELCLCVLKCKKLSKQKPFCKHTRARGAPGVPIRGSHSAQGHQPAGPPAWPVGAAW